MLEFFVRVGSCSSFSRFLPEAKKGPKILMLIHHEKVKHIAHKHDCNHPIHFLFLWGPVIIRFEEMHKTFKRAPKPG